MAFLSSFLPGLREVRAPLVGGYLWLLFVWLAADPASPQVADHGPYGRLDEVAQAMGTVGHAVVASVAAYLLGSLVTSLVLAAVRRANERWSTPTYWPGNVLEDLSYKESQGRAGTELDLEDLALLAGVGYETRLGRTDKILLRSVEEMVDRELGDSFHSLRSAIDRAIELSGRPTFRFIQRMDGGVAVLSVEDGAHPNATLGISVEIPRFSVARDLYREFPILRTRLTEHSVTTGGAVERLHTEAEFRFAVAAPLFALVLLFASTAPLWLVGLVGPVALAVQGFSLERQGNRQLVDALRARSGTDELIQITPVFARYRNQAGVLGEALERMCSKENESVAASGPGVAAGPPRWRALMRRSRHDSAASSS